VVDAYQAAQTAGDKSKMPLSPSATFTENFKTTTKGIWETPLVVAYRHDLLDTFACQTFSEVYVTEGTQQYVNGIHLTVKDGQITELESIVTTGTVSGTTITSKDWNFDAQAYLTCAKSEDWSVVPEAQRNTREQLIAAGEAYFKVFSDKATAVPWGTPCYRLEGGKGCTPARTRRAKAATSASRRHQFQEHALGRRSRAQHGRRAHAVAGALPTATRSVCSTARSSRFTP